MPTPTARRSFLKGLAALPVIAKANLTAAAAAFEQDPESYWKLVRRQFAFGEDKAPMNAANLCPSPLSVAERVTDLTRDIDRDCSFQNRSKFRQLLEESRRRVAEQLKVSPDEIALVRNTSEGNCIVNNGLPLESGDEIVLWSENHPTNNVAWDVRAARFGWTVRRVETPARPRTVDDLIEPFVEAFSPRTRVLALTHVSNVSGVRLPVAQLCRIAHRREIHVHVDGAQTWGALDLNLRELECDSFAASSHKWFVGPKEAGVLFVKKERIGNIWPGGVAPGWGSSPETELEGARKFESLGQRDDACLAAVATAVDFHQTIGAARIEARITELAGRLKQGLAELGGRLVSPAEPQLSAGVCIVEVKPEHRREMFERLYQEHGIAGAATGGLRLCPHVYNTMEHVERALKGVRALRSLLA